MRPFKIGTASCGSMATGSASLMKEFVRRQLRHWVEGFRDEQLPRDLGARGFGRPQLSLAKVREYQPIPRQCFYKT